MEDEDLFLAMAGLLFAAVGLVTGLFLITRDEQVAPARPIPPVVSSLPDTHGESTARPRVAYR